MRIEVYEKYEFYDRDEPDWEQMGVARPKNPPQYSYRRTYLDAFQIERPIEIPGNKKELILRLLSGEDMIIKCNYDEFCITLDDIEEQMKNSGMIAYAWYVWDKDYVGKPTIEWIR